MLKAPWDGGPLIINPIYTLYHVGHLLGILVPLLEGSNRRAFLWLDVYHPVGPMATSYKLGEMGPL